MPDQRFMVSKTTGKQISFGEAAKKFRATPGLDKSFLDLKDDAMLVAIAASNPEAYEIKTVKPPPDTRKFAPSKMNEGAMSLEQVETLPVFKPLEDNQVYSTLRNFGTGAKNTLFGMASGAAGVWKAATDGGKDMGALFDGIKELQVMDPNSPDYEQKYAQLQYQASKAGMPDLTQLPATVIESYKQKYGGDEPILRKAKRALVEDPFGTLGDVASVGTGVAGVARAGAAGLGRAAANTTGKLASAATKAQKAAQFVDRAGRAVATYADPINLPIETVKLIDDKVLTPLVQSVDASRDAKAAAAAKGSNPPLVTGTPPDRWDVKTSFRQEYLAEPLYRAAAGLQDTNAQRVDAAVKAGLDKGGPTLGTGRDDTSFVARRRNSVREMFGDPLIEDSLDTFQRDVIEPKQAQYRALVQEMENQGKIIDTRTFRDDAVKELLGSPSSIHQKELKGVTDRIDRMLRDQGFIAQSESGKTYYRGMKPTEAMAMKAKLNDAVSSFLEKAAARQTGDAIEGAALDLVSDNRVRKLIIQKFNEMSPELGEIGQELAGMIRLKDTALERRGAQLPAKGKMLNMSLPEATALFAAGLGVGNWTYHVARLGLSFINSGKGAAAKFAKAIAAKPELFNLGKGVFRAAGYQVANLGDIEKIAKGEGQKLMNAAGVAPPATRDEDRNMMGQEDPKAAQPPAPRNQIMLPGAPAPRAMDLERERMWP